MFGLGVDFNHIQGAQSHQRVATYDLMAQVRQGRSIASQAKGPGARLCALTSSGSLVQLLFVKSRHSRGDEHQNITSAIFKAEEECTPMLLAQADVRDARLDITALRELSNANPGAVLIEPIGCRLMLLYEVRGVHYINLSLRDPYHLFDVPARYASGTRRRSRFATDPTVCHRLRITSLQPLRDFQLEFGQNCLPADVKECPAACAGAFAYELTMPEATLFWSVLGMQPLDVHLPERAEPPLSPMASAASAASPVELRRVREEETPERRQQRSAKRRARAETAEKISKMKVRTLSEDNSEPDFVSCCDGDPWPIGEMYTDFMAAQRAVQMC